LGVVQSCLRLITSLEEMGMTTEEKSTWRNEENEITMTSLQSTWRDNHNNGYVAMFGNLPR